MKCFILHVLSNKKIEQEQYIPRTRDPNDVHLKSKTLTMVTPVVAPRHLPSLFLVL